MVPAETVTAKMPGPGNYKIIDHVVGSKSTKNKGTFSVSKRFEEMEPTPGPSTYNIGN